MKQLLILLFALLSLVSYGQGSDQVLRQDFGIYRGNAKTSPVMGLLPADTVGTEQISVTVRPVVGSGLTNPQPTWTLSGLNLTFRFATSETLPELSQYEVSVNGQKRFAGLITTNKQQVVVPPQFPVTVLSGIYSQLGVLQGLINNIGAGEVTLSVFSNFTAITGQRLASIESDVASRVTTSSYNSFTAATGASLTQQANDIANRVLTSDFNTFKTNNALSISGINSALALRLLISDTTGFQRRIAGYGLYPNADKIKLAGIAIGATNVDSTLLVRKSTYALDKAVTNTAIAIRLTQAQADLLYKPVGYVPTYAGLPDKPLIPSAPSDIGAVAQSTYGADKTAQGTLDAAQNTNITALQSGKLDGATYNTNRSADQLATTTAQNTANTALSTANSATVTGASNSNAITTNKASADAHIANTNNPHGTTAAQVGAVATGTYTADKATQSTLDANQNTAITLASPRSFTSYAAANAASLTATAAQTWVVTADETTLNAQGQPMRVTYWFDGATLYYPVLSRADGAPGGSNSTALNGYYQKVTVADKASANAAATGSQAKIITVTTDESDSNRTNKYIYDGDNQPLGNPLF